MTISFSYRKGIFFLILLNPILSIVFDDTNVYYFYIMGPLLFLLLLFYNCKNRNIVRYSFFVTACTSFSVIFAILFGTSRSDLGKINNHLFSYLDCVLLLLLLSEDKNIRYFETLIIQKLTAIKFIVILINFIEGFLLITRRGYSYHFSWGGTFFHGTNNMPHTLACLMIVTLFFVCILIRYTEKRRYILGAIIPFLAIFASGARSLLLVSVFPMLLIIDMVFTKKQKSIFFKIMVVLLILIVIAFIFRNEILTSDLWNKILIKQDSGNNSSGRLYMWSDLINRYIHSYNPIKYLFGQGDYMTYYYNSVNPLVHVNVWAHNDFLQILVGKGALGLFFYIYALVRCGSNIFKNNKNFYKYFILASIILAAIINGFYSYRDIMLVLPFIIVLARYYGYYGEKQNVSELLDKIRV